MILINFSQQYHQPLITFLAHYQYFLKDSLKSLHKFLGYFAKSDKLIRVSSLFHQPPPLLLLSPPLHNNPIGNNNIS